MLYGACVVLGGAVVLIMAGRNGLTLMVLGSLTIVAFVCVRVFGRLRFDALWAGCPKTGSIRAALPRPG